MDRIEIADAIADAINEDGRATARVWEGRTGLVRVYVSRTLSRGRRQDIGHYEVDEDGDVEGRLARNAAHFDRIVREVTG